MLLDWFSKKHIDEFADSIVAEVKQRFPQSGVDLSTPRSAEKSESGARTAFGLVGEGKTLPNAT